jgi:predicted ribosome quality control (RQC) complex YloA/Tae2 family protein
VEADPALTLREVAEKYYRKAKKARDSKKFLHARLASLNDEYNDIFELLRQAELSKTIQEVAFIEKEAVKRGVSQNSAGNSVPDKRNEQESQFDGHKIRRFRSPDGWEVLVGENATSNDYLTTKVASPNDIWLHARSGTSAHAVIRTQNRPVSVSSQAIRFASELVAKRSGAKHAGIVPIDYTLKKFVRKPRKSPPGTVTYNNEKTIDVSPDDVND